MRLFRRSARSTRLDTRSPSANRRSRGWQRSLHLEKLEGRALLAQLVADVVGGFRDTTITGTVYEDLDSNGALTGGEIGLADWTVFLDLDHSGTLNQDANGVTEPSATTDGDGVFVLDHLQPGNYRVAAVIPAGWKPTSPRSLDVSVVAHHDTPADFFVFGGGSISGTVWNDQNHDGLRATDPVTGSFTEPGLNGWTVFLDIDGNRTPSADEPATNTAADGSYGFDELPPGDYEVTIVLPAGWDVPEGYDIRQTVAVQPLDVATQDFASFSDLQGLLHGSVWNDVNIDGVRNSDPVTGEFLEPGLEGWTVFLDLDGSGTLSTDPTGTPEPAALTDADGNYHFVSLPAGTYELLEILTEGWNASPDFSDRQTVKVEAGRDTAAEDFANFSVSNGGIRGVIWNDANRNGTRDADLTGTFTEPGLAGWTVFLDLNRTGVADPGEPVAITDAAGQYAFADLQVGDYEVREVLPTGWEVAATFSDSYGVSVYSGSATVAPDFANYDASAAAPGSVRGQLFQDLDGNGLRAVDPDTGAFREPALTGWTVFLDLNANGTADSGEPQTTSAADGSYSFTQVTPGTVRVVEVVPPGWRAVAPATALHALALRSGQEATGLDFANLELQDSTIRGTVFYDANHDGLRSADERGLPGITVYLDLDNDGLPGATEPQLTTSSDLYYTPASDEAGTYAFTHLAKGTYTVRVVVPAVLSATPTAERVHVVEIVAAEDRGGVNTAAVFRRSEIHGVHFEDRDGDHLRDADEPTVAGTTIYVDLDRDNVRDPDEPTTVTAADGSYTFTDLAPGAYVVRSAGRAGYDDSFPTTTGGILWPGGVSHAAVGQVTPSSITTSLAVGETYRQTVSLTLPPSGALTNLVDVFLLFDDTGSFVNNSPIVRGAFPDIIAQLQSSLPGIDLGFGVGRLEEYADYAFEYSTGRPFVLNQPIVAAGTPGYLAAIQAALDRTTPGYGGDEPETDIEALYQLVTGVGFDGNNNGSVLDSGRAGLVSTQLDPGASGDVPSFASFQPDPAGNVLPAAGSLGGGGFRAGALPIVLLATDTGFAYQPKGETVIQGVGGLTLPVSDLTGTSRSDTPFNYGAGIQETVTGLNALGALVIGLGTNPEPNVAPRQPLEALSKLTGATNQSSTTIDNGTADPIAPGDPLYFEIASGFASSVANGVVTAIQNAVTNVAVNITVQASDPRVRLINHSGTALGVTAGQTAAFDIEFVGDGIPHRFDLQFVRQGTNVVLGSIPVVLGTPVPGDGYEFEDLEDGEIELEAHFGDRLSTSPTNTPPLAANDSYVTNEDQPLVVAASGVLANDSDTDGDTLTASIVDQPTHGTVTLNADGSFTYTPTANYHGTDSFTYVAGDGSATSTAATVQLTVQSVNDAPSAANDSYATDEDQPLVVAAASGVLANDSDTDGDTLTASIVDQPTHGTVTLNADGSFTYTPTANYHGTDSFTYVAGDGSATSTAATVQLIVQSVNDAPSAANDSYVTDEDQPLVVAAVSGVLANDSDTDGDALTASIVDQPTHGTVTLNADGSFTYAPAANYHGTDSFTYVAGDGSATSTAATVQLTVQSVNDAPSAANDSYATDEDQPLVVTAASGVLANDSDTDGDALTASIVDQPTHGTVTLNAGGSFTYTPTANYHGTDSFTYVAGDGSATSSAATVQLTVQSVNDAPSAANDSYVTNEDQPLVVAASGVLANDSDIDGDALTASIVDQPAHGTVTLNADGSFTYTPTANYHGTDSFTYVAGDGSATSSAATVQLTVQSVNDAPSAANDSYVTNEDQPLVVAASGVLANDSDIDGDALTASIVDQPAHGTVTLNADGSFTYTPAANYHGTDSFTYVAGDGTATSTAATVQLTVRATAGAAKFYVVDSSARGTFEYDAAGNLVTRRTLNKEDESQRGIATNRDGSRTWVLDANGKVFVYDRNGAKIGMWEAKGVGKPEGIATDGQSIWIVDSDAKKILYYADAAKRLSGGSSATLRIGLARDNRNPTDLTTDGHFVWVVNDTSTVDTVFRYTVGGALTGSWRIDSANARPTGITIDPNHVNDVWIVDASTLAVYQYAGAAQRRMGSQRADDVFALAADNRNPQGLADPSVGESGIEDWCVPAVAASPGLALPLSPAAGSREVPEGESASDEAIASRTNLSPTPSSRTNGATVASLRDQALGDWFQSASNRSRLPGVAPWAWSSVVTDAADELLAALSASS